MFSAAETFLDHVKWLRRAARAVGADLIFAGDSMQALLRKAERTLLLHPQFLTLVDGSVRRTPHLHDASGPFLGWTPYRSKSWPIAVDRLAFKKFAAEAGLPVPPAPPASPAPTDVVVRRVQPAFEPHLAGPIRSASERPLDEKVAEFYEKYVEGDALTVWFWDGQPTCAELAPTPAVVGDGKTQLGELLVRGAGKGGQLPPAVLRARLAECDVLARFKGRALSTVLPEGEKMTVGLGHGSPLLAASDRRIMDLTGNPELPWLAVMRKAGPALLSAVPEESRPGTIFAVNAVVDREGAVWLLDMDASPRVHPLAYGPMLASLLPAGKPAATPGPQAAPETREAPQAQPNTRTP